MKSYVLAAVGVVAVQLALPSLAAAKDDAPGIRADKAHDDHSSIDAERAGEADFGCRSGARLCAAETAHSGSRENRDASGDLIARCMETQMRTAGKGRSPVVRNAIRFNCGAR